jgi:A/G-specific adenine glycosylase
VRARWSAVGRQVEHTFTHFHLVLTLWRANVNHLELPTGDYRWVTPDALVAQALPSLMKKVVAEVRRGAALKAR